MIRILLGHAEQPVPHSFSRVVPSLPTYCIFMASLIKRQQENLNHVSLHLLTTALMSALIFFFPTSVLGGFRAQGRTAVKARQVLDDALAVQDAGAFAVVVECVPTPVAKAVTAALEIPTIGIGAGAFTSGQVGMERRYIQSVRLLFVGVIWRWGGSTFLICEELV